MENKRLLSNASNVEKLGTCLDFVLRGVVEGVVEEAVHLVEAGHLVEVEGAEEEGAEEEGEGGEEAGSS